MDHRTQIVARRIPHARPSRWTAVALLAGAATITAVSAADAQQRVDQRRSTSGAERVQPARAGGPPPSGTLPQTGRGQRVDQSASQFRGGANPIVGDRGEEFRRRNAVVTGNEAGGRGFRGSAGYSAPFDFRGDADAAAFGASALGSDDLFDFRAGSLFSDPRLIQSAPSMRFGAVLGQFEVYRTARGTAADDLRRSDLQNQQLNELERLQGELNSRVSELRRIVDASALDAGLDRFVAQAGAAQPVGRVIGREDVVRRLNASPLAGLQPALSDTDLNQFGVPTSGIGAFGGERTNPYLIIGRLSAMDQARLIEDAREGRRTGVVGEAFRDSFVDTRVDASDRMNQAREERVDGTVPSNRVGAVDPDAAADSIPAWQRIREEIARRYASDGRGGATVDGNPTEGELRRFETDLERLRRGLGASPGSTTSPERPGTGLPRTGVRDPDDPDAADDDPRADAAERLDLLRMGRSLRHGQRIDSLVDAEDRSRAGELIGSAEQELRRGDYFRAERTFTRALRLVPGHPTATAGLAHARLGAGLFIPAALVVRDLFTYQPEMIGATYAEGLVPNRPRLLQALETLRGRVDDERDATDTGLMLAYIGRLLDRPDVIREGLNVMSEASEDDPLLGLLSAVWLEGPLEGVNRTDG